MEDQTGAERAQELGDSTDGNTTYCGEITPIHEGVTETKEFNPEEDSNLYQHAKRELEVAGWLDDQGMYGDLIGKAVLDLISVFAKQGHSGMSAPCVISLFAEVAKFKPLCPLTGEDDEWNEVAEGVWQNKRYSSVFKQADRYDGQAYDVDGCVFRRPDGVCFTNGDSQIPIIFPYLPTSKYVDVDENDNVIDKDDYPEDTRL